MLFFSSILFHSHSKRIPVRMLSSANTNYRYLWWKSPTKKDTRMAYRKHDPIINRHVIFYEQPPKQKEPIMMKRDKRNAREFGAFGLEKLIAKEAKYHKEYGRIRVGKFDILRRKLAAQFS